MAYIRVAPELHLILDPTTGVVATEREDVVEYTLDNVMTRIGDLDKIVTDMMDQLDPNAPLLSSFPGREKASYNAGLLTNAFYGAIVGFIISFIILILSKALNAMGGTI